MQRVFTITTNAFPVWAVLGAEVALVGPSRRGLGCGRLDYGGLGQ